MQTYLHKSTDRRLYISFYTQLGAAATVTLPLTGCCFIVINLSMQFSLTHLPQSHRIHFGIFIIGFGRSCACGNGCEKHINYAHQLISIGFFQLFNFKARGRCKMCKQPSAESKCKYLSTFNGYLGSTVASRPDLHSEGNKEWNQERMELKNEGEASQSNWQFGFTCVSISDSWYLNCTSLLLRLLRCKSLRLFHLTAGQSGSEAP